MNKPKVSSFIKKDPSELSNGEILIGYQNYSKALEKYVDHLEALILTHVSDSRQGE